MLHIVFHREYFLLFSFPLLFLMFLVQHYFWYYTDEVKRSDLRNLCTILVILIQSLQGMEISRINSICYLFYATSRNLFITTLISALNDFYSNWLKLSHDENRSSQFVKFVLTYEVEILITLSVENEYEFAIILWIWMWQSQSDRSHRYFTFTFTDCLLDKKILLLKITLFCYVEDYLCLVSADFYYISHLWVEIALWTVLHVNLFYIFLPEAVWPKKIAEYE